MGVLLGVHHETISWAILGTYPPASTQEEVAMEHVWVLVHNVPCMYMHVLTYWHTGTSRDTTMHKGMYTCIHIMCAYTRDVSPSSGGVSIDPSLQHHVWMDAQPIHSIIWMDAWCIIPWVVVYPWDAHTPIYPIIGHVHTMGHCMGSPMWLPCTTYGT